LWFVIIRAEESKAIRRRLESQWSIFEEVDRHNWMILGDEFRQ
jgi:hypothetical protein